MREALLVVHPDLDWGAWQFPKLEKDILQALPQYKHVAILRASENVHPEFLKYPALDGRVFDDHKLPLYWDKLVTAWVKENGITQLTVSGQNMNVCVMNSLPACRVDITLPRSLLRDANYRSDPQGQDLAYAYLKTHLGFETPLPDTPSRREGTYKLVGGEYQLKNGALSEDGSPFIRASKDLQFAWSERRRYEVPEACRSSLFHALGVARAPWYAR